MKKQTFIPSIFILVLAIIGLISCEKENSKNQDSKNPTLQLKFNTPASNSSPSSAWVDSIHFTDGRFILENIAFSAESDTDSLEVDFDIDAYITIDYATGNITPDLSAIEISPGVYTNIELEFEYWDQTEQPSVYLEGTLTDTSGTLHPIILIMPLGQKFSMEIEGEYTVQQNTAMIAYITIDPTAWFVEEALDLLSSATKNNAGIIVISPEQNYDIYDIIKDAVDEFSEIEIKM